MSPTTSPNSMSPTDVPSLQALVQSFSMIIVSKIGDKTLLIAAILAMWLPRLTVFLGAFLSMLLMSFLSAALGHLLPTLIPQAWTQWCAAALFLIFGMRMWGEASRMQNGNGKLQDEMQEVEEEIEDDERVQPSWSEGVQNFCSLLLGPVLVQAFVPTFLGEWGDRSQIAIISLGAAHNVYLLTFGTVLGHLCCTALAVIGGRYISNKISVKHGFVTSASDNINLMNMDIPVPVN
ncbi:hypothetical protein CVT25_013238 [Psilocybe cyanescens]|uniref:GDT1 family protein n=1 Tax=Psilocybe cyanescens TaxID=93625 RepID=A0A409XLW4_PSICY|nr:hypothetical protein CVT25_013238 [Psilocybe cyanescens]